jgi:hypothetical protein
VSPASVKTEVSDLSRTKKYFVQPEYWQISVEWDRAEAILQSVTPCKVSLPLAGVLGSNGVDVVGRDKSEKTDVR